MSTTKAKRGRGRSRPSPSEIARIQAERARNRSAQNELQEAGVGVQQALRYQFEQHTVTVHEDWSGEGSGLAGMQWLGGVTLARYLDNRSVYPHGCFAGLRAIELGAGCGLTSTLLALRGVSHVTVTDMDPQKARETLEMNLPKSVWEHRVKLAELAWGVTDLARFDPPFDLILAGDCFYSEAVVETLLQVMWDLSSETTTVLVCGIVGQRPFKVYNRHVDRFFEIVHVIPSAMTSEELKMSASGAAVAAAAPPPPADGEASAAQSAAAAAALSTSSAAPYVGTAEDEMVLAEGRRASDGVWTMADGSVIGVKDRSRALMILKRRPTVRPPDPDEEESEAEEEAKQDDAATVSTGPPPAAPMAAITGPDGVPLSLPEPHEVGLEEPEFQDA